MYGPLSINRTAQMTEIEQSMLHNLCIRVNGRNLDGILNKTGRLKDLMLHSLFE